MERSRPKGTDGSDYAYRMTIDNSKYCCCCCSSSSSSSSCSCSCCRSPSLGSLCFSLSCNGCGNWNPVWAIGQGSDMEALSQGTREQQRAGSASASSYQLRYRHRRTERQREICAVQLAVAGSAFFKRNLKPFLLLLLLLLLLRASQVQGDLQCICVLFWCAFFALKR